MPRIPVSRLSLGGLVAACSSMGATSTSALTSPCPAGAPPNAECRIVRVAEREGATDGRRIDVLVMRIPAITVPALPDPLVVIVGGPGQAASAMASMLSGRFAAIRQRRDLLLVDQRGTGGSNRLACASGAVNDPARLLGPVFTAEEISTCARTLSASADLTAYTTRDAVRDLEEVRRALAVERWTLAAGSYGTKVAMEYARQYPGSTRALVLEGVAGPEYPNPLPHARAGQRALESLFADCDRDVRCRGAYPDLSRGFAALLARLDSSSVEVSVPGRSGPGPRLDRDNFAYGLHLLLFANQSAAAVPFLVSRAVAGDYWPMASVLAQAASGLAGQVDLGMQLSVTCAEDAPMYSKADVEREGVGTYLRGTLAGSSKDECARWPVGAAPPLPVVPLVVPALLVGGAHDPATPLEYARGIAGRMPNAELLVVPYGAHVTIDACVNGIIASYVARLSVTEAERGCLASGSRPPFLVPGS